MKKGAIFVIVFFIVIGIASFLIYLNLVNIICSSKNSLNDKDTCFFDHAGTQKNLKFCDKIIDGNFKASCYKEMAVLLKEEYICRSIGSDQEFFKTTCFLELANIKGDLSLCANIENDNYYRGYCKVLVAIKNKDSSICNDLEAQYYIFKDKCPSCEDSESRNYIFDESTCPACDSSNNAKNICTKRVQAGSNGIL